MSLFEIKERMTELKAAINEDSTWISQKAADPATPMDELNSKKKHRDELVARYEMLKAEHDELEATQKEAVKRDDDNGSAEDEAIKKKAAFIRAAFTGGDMRKAYEGLGALPANISDLGHGDRLLPKNMSNELLLEPLEENSLRTIENVSQISGLEEPKLLFSIEDTSLADVTDQETAREIKADGETVTYGRFKTKIFATIKDTVLQGTDYDVVTAVENALRSGLAIKEKINAFRVESDGTHDHMSFYLNEIKEVSGANIILAIINAWADLPEAFATNAKCVMRKSDYYAAIQTLANGKESLWGKKPEDALGIPVVFNDRAVRPIVGDFRYSRQNYDIGTLFDTDKDGKKGEYYFILTAWGDHRIRLKNAFRIAKVSDAAAASENP